MELRTRVFIVENEVVLAKSLQQQLEVFGYAVVGRASTGEQAITGVKETRPDIVLMDIHLGNRGMDGITAAEQIRAHSDVPLVYLTAHDDEETLQRAKKTEPHGYILKPYGEADVRVAIEVALQKYQSEQAVQQAYAKLDQLVQERTAELSQANEALQKSLRLKNEFLATMSHELRTPLSGILGFSEALLEEVYGELTDKQQQILRMIEKSGQQLLDMINMMLDFAYVISGDFRLNTILTHVKRLGAASICAIEQLAHQKRLRVAFGIKDAASETISIKADEQRLEHVLVLLLKNAVKFTPEGRAIGLDITTDEATQHVTFTVWDTGIGIAPEDRERLFQPFAQLDSGLSRRYEGIGLGLAFADQIVKLHGGRLQVESNVNEGSRFIVTLPWQRPAEEKK